MSSCMFVERFHLSNYYIVKKISLNFQENFLPKKSIGENDYFLSMEVRIFLNQDYGIKLMKTIISPGHNYNHR